MKRDKLQETIDELFTLATALRGFHKAAEELPRLRECAKRAGRLSQHIASLARSRERSRCRHDFPETRERNAYYTCARCHLCRWLKATNKGTGDKE